MYKEKKKLRFPFLFWSISFGIILLIVSIGWWFNYYIDKGAKIENWIKICMAHNSYFMPGLLVPVIAIFIVGGPLGILSSKIIGESRIIRTFNFLSLCLTDILESLPKYPTILLGVLIIQHNYSEYWEQYKLLSIMIILGVLNSSKISRILKAKIDSLKEREYIEAAESFGISRLRLIFVHILKCNCMPIFITQACFQMIDVILIEIGLTFIMSTDENFGIMGINSFGEILCRKDDLWMFRVTLFLVIFNILTFLNLAQIIEKKFVRREEYDTGI